MNGNEDLPHNFSLNGDCPNTRLGGDRSILLSYRNKTQYYYFSLFIYHMQASILKSLGFNEAKRFQDRPCNDKMYL